jgi:TonB family protein
MHLWQLLCGLALVISCSSVTSAEDIAGKLYDRAGGVIGGARVMLMSEDYVKLSETRSGDRGEFSFRNAKPGLYFVQAKKPMFHLAQQHVLLKAGQEGHVHLIANVARADEQITVETDRLPGVEPSTARTAIYRAGGKVEGFQLLSGRPPGFPESAKQRGANGTVVLLATIKLDGTLTDFITLESPDPELERASLDAFNKWRYSPMKLDGAPVESNVVVMFEFKYSERK